MATARSPAAHLQRALECGTKDPLLRRAELVPLEHPQGSGQSLHRAQPVRARIMAQWVEWRIRGDDRAWERRDSG